MPPENPRPSSVPPYYSPNPSPAPQQMPTPPYQVLSPDPVFPDQSQLAAHYIKPRRSWILPLLFVLFVAIVTTAAYYGLRAYRNNPAVIFDQALSQSLHTKQVKENISGPTAAANVVYDGSDPKKPRISTLITTMFGANTYIKGYGTLDTTYFSYANDPANSATPQSLRDRWVQVRENGTLPDGVVLNPLITTIDPRYQLLSPWTFGNLSNKDSGTLIKLAHGSKLYAFDSKKVTRATINKHAVLVYDLALDSKKLAAYMTKAGQIYGISQDDTNAAIKMYGSRISMKIFVRKDTHQVVRIDMTNDGVATNITYDYGNQTLPSEPNPDLTYANFLSALGS